MLYPSAYILAPAPFYLLSYVVCVCVCVMERETPVGRRILTSETQPVRFTNDPVLLSLSLSLSSVCVGVECFVVVVVSGPFKSRSHHHAPPNKIIIATHITKRVKILQEKKKKGISKGKKKKSTHPLKSRNEKEGEERISTDEKK